MWVLATPPLHLLNLPGRSMVRQGWYWSSTSPKPSWEKHGEAGGGIGPLAGQLCQDSISCYLLIWECLIKLSRWDNPHYVGYRATCMGGGGGGVLDLKLWEHLYQHPLYRY